MKIRAFISGCEGLALSAAETEFFRESRPWGLILFKRNCETAEQLLELTNAFRAAVGRKDAPVLVDQEGGRVQRLGPPLQGWRKYPSARMYGEIYAENPLGALRSARNVGRLMAEDLIACGINVNCIPVLDVPQAGASDVIGNRAYGFKEIVIALARSFTTGMMEGGVLPIMKHIPGHGRSEVDSHYNLPVVHASKEQLQAVDFPPFAALADLPMAMTAHIVFTAYDKNFPATQSKKIIKSVIRQDIGFQGLLMTDDLSMKALSGSIAEKCEKSLAAGCDMVLHCNGILNEMREVAASVGALKGRAARRAKLALKARRKPQPYDQKAAISDLEQFFAIA